MSTRDAHLPLVSVIMNCHNGATYLREAISSVYSQIFDDWEIIFWDNASSDQSSKIANSFDNRLHYFRTDTLLPLYTARNLALDQCRGELVTFLDVDDIWLPHKLSAQLSIYKEGIKLIYGPYLLIDSEGNQLTHSVVPSVSGFITNKILSRNPISIGCVLIDAKLLKSEKFDPFYNLLGDFDLWVRLSLKYPFLCTETPLELSRQHSSNTSILLKDGWLTERRYFYLKFIRLAGFIRFPRIILYIIKAEIMGLLQLFS